MVAQAAHGALDDGAGGAVADRPDDDGWPVVAGTWSVTRWVAGTAPR